MSRLRGSHPGPMFVRQVALCQLSRQPGLTHQRLHLVPTCPAHLTTQDALCLTPKDACRPSSRNALPPVTPPTTQHAHSGSSPPLPHPPLQWVPSLHESLKAKATLLGLVGIFRPGMAETKPSATTRVAPTPTLTQLGNSIGVGSASQPGWGQRHPVPGLGARRGRRSRREIAGVLPSFLIGASGGTEVHTPVRDLGKSGSMSGGAPPPKPTDLGDRTLHTHTQREAGLTQVHCRDGGFVPAFVHS